MAILWGMVAAGLALTDLGLLDDRPISHLGTVAETILLFRAGLVVSAVLLAAFTFFARSVFAVPVGFVVASLVGLVGQVVAGIVPIDGPGSQHAVHTIGGLVLGASLPLLMWRFAAAQPPGPWRVTAYRLFWLEAVACGAGLLLSRAGQATVAEILPAVAFHLWIGVVTARARFQPAVAGSERLFP